MKQNTLLSIGTNISIKNLTLKLTFYFTFLYVSPTISQVTNFNNTIDWVSNRDISSQQFSKFFEKYSKRGYMMVDIDAYLSNGKTLYSMVWKKNVDNRAWSEYRDMTSEEYHEKWKEYKERNFRPVDVEAYYKNGKIKYAGIWIKNKEGLQWSSKRNLSSSQYSDYFKKQSDKGYRVIDIEAYKVGNKTKYAAIWIENRENIKWAQYRNMSRSSYQKKVNEFNSKGYIVVDYEQYKIGNKNKYAAIWIKKPNVKYHLRTNRSEREFSNLWREYNDKGYRLIDFERDGDSYAGIWIQNDLVRLNYSKKNKISNIITSYMDSVNLPGISVTIIENGKIKYTRGFGFADIKNNKKAWSGTVYLQASISKAIAGTIATKLASKGKLENGQSVDLKLDEKTSTYLTNIKNSSGETVSIPSHHNHTVEQLFSHLACVRHYRTGTEPEKKYYKNAIDALEQIWNDSLIPDCTIGSSENYSTHALTYAAAVLEEVSGLTSAQLIRNEIAIPYKLYSLRAMYGNKNLYKNYDRAEAYSRNNNEIEYEQNSWKILGGGIESSTKDLARFGWKVFNGEIIDPTTRDSILWKKVNSNTEHGISWKIIDSIAQHEGIAKGARSLLRIYRNDNLVIAINTNRWYLSSFSTLANNIKREVVR